MKESNFDRKNNDVLIRPLKCTDDINAIARCIFLTDPFIYPSLVDKYDHPDFLSLIKDWINFEGHLFCHKNYLVASIRNTVAGIINYYHCTEAVSFEKRVLLSSDGEKRYELIKQNYFSPLIEKNFGQRYIYINCLSVLPEWQRMGIGSKLIKELCSQYPDTEIVLDTIKTNKSAVELYKKNGFRIEEEFNGFGSNSSCSVLCYKMTFCSNRLL